MPRNVFFLRSPPPKDNKTLKECEITGQKLSLKNIHQGFS